MKLITQEGLRWLGVSGNKKHLVSYSQLIFAPSLTNKKRDFGMDISGKMYEGPARILDNPKVVYRNNKSINSRATWNLIGTKFSNGATMNKWAVLVVEDRKGQIPRGKLPEFLSKFQEVCNNSGIQTSNCSQKLDVQLGDVRDFEAFKKKLEPAFKSAIASGVQAVLVLLSVRDKLNRPIYAAIKYVADVQCGISTVCTHWEKMVKDWRKMSMHIANLALKFNLKLGGVNHELSPADLGMLEDGNVMMVGADVTHSSPGSVKTAPSIASVVASIDGKYCQYPCSMRVQRPGNHEVRNCSLLFTQLTLLITTFSR